MSLTRTKIYAQKDHRLVVGGKALGGFMDGTPFTVEFVGGEVDITEGTDGPGINRATQQGGRLHFTLRETSDDCQYLYDLFQQQDFSESTTTAVLYSGSKILYSFSDGCISLPGDLTTGDKKQAGIEFVFVARVILQNQAS